MNIRRTNILFLVIIICYIGGSYLLSMYPNPISQDVAASLIASQVLIILPALNYYAVGHRKNPGFLRTGKVHISTLLMTILYTALCIPLVTLLNAISMMFVENEFTGINNEILEKPFWLIFLIMAVLGPFCEEFVFRGMIFQGYRRGGNTFLAVLMSSLLFGLMHLNFNQAPYAFAIGIMLALLMEATDNFLTSFFMHLLFNANSVCLMYLGGSMAEEAAGIMNYRSEEWIFAVSLYLVLALAATPLAFCVLAWIAKREGRVTQMKQIWSGRQIGIRKYFSLLFVVVVSVCLAFMIWRMLQ